MGEGSNVRSWGRGGGKIQTPSLYKTRECLSFCTCTVFEVICTVVQFVFYFTFLVYV